MGGLLRWVVDVFRKGKFELLALTEIKLKGDGEVSRCGANRMCVGFMNLDNLYDRINREALWQVLRMYNGWW